VGSYRVLFGVSQDARAGFGGGKLDETTEAIGIEQATAIGATT